MSKNLATTTIASHPGPPTSATSVTVATGTGSRLYAGMAVIHPANTQPTPANAEVISIADVTGDVLTIVRAQESSTARAIATGDVITQGITASMWDTLVASNAAKAAASHVHSAADITSGTLPLARGGTGGTDAATARTSLGLGTAAVESPATLAANTAFTATYGLRAPDWVTGRSYVVGELVHSGGVLYRCTTAHTSSGSIALGNFASLSGGGGTGLPSTFVTRTTTTTAAAGQFVLADASTAAFTVTLPAGQPAGTLVAVKKTDPGSNIVTVLPASGTIDGDPSAAILSLGAGAIFASDGVGWRISAVFAPSLTGASGMIGGGKAGDLYGYRSSFGTQSLSYPAGREHAVPFVLPVGRSVSGVSLRVETAAVGGTARLGWRADDNGWPGALVQELGTVSTAATGTVTLSAPFSPGGGVLWWLTLTPQVAAPALRSDAVAVIGGKLEGCPMPADALTAGRLTPIQDSVTGALPATFSGRGLAGGATTGLPPLLLVTLA